MRTRKKKKVKMSEALTRCSTLTAGYEFNFLYSFIHPSSDRDQILWSKVAKTSICVLSLLCVVPLVTSGLGCFSMGEHQRQIKRWHFCYFVIIGFFFFSLSVPTSDHVNSWAFLVLRQSTAVQIKHPQYLVGDKRSGGVAGAIWGSCAVPRGWSVNGVWHLL